MTPEAKLLRLPWSARPTVRPAAPSRATRLVVCTPTLLRAAITAKASTAYWASDARKRASASSTWLRRAMRRQIM